MYLSMNGMLEGTLERMRLLIEILEIRKLLAVKTTTESKAYRLVAAGQL